MSQDPIQEVKVKANDETVEYDDDLGVQRKEITSLSSSNSKRKRGGKNSNTSSIANRMYNQIECIIEIFNSDKITNVPIIAYF